jgi:ElaB/YqjD/DUF883 family membrane-anchored ribosome-binding protein
MPPRHTVDRFHEVIREPRQAMRIDTPSLPARKRRRGTHIDQETQTMNASLTPAAREHLFEEFNTLLGETQSLIRSAAELGGDKASAMEASVASGLASAVERLARIRDQAVHQATSTAHAADRYVHEKPWQTVGIVAALSAVTGVVAGMLIARR